MAIQIIGIGLLATLGILLFRRKAHLELPFFFIYVICAIFITLARMSVASNYLLYFKVYWTTETLYAVLGMLALFEAFHEVFIDDYRRWPWFWMVFPGAVLLLTIISVVLTVLHPPAEAPPLILLVLSFETAVNWVQGCLFIMFLVLAWILIGENWPTFPYGVVAGFAVSSALSFGAYWLRSIFGTKLNWVGKYGPPLSYILAVVIWIASCYLPEEPQRRLAGLDDPEKALATVRQYQRALKWIAGKR